MEPPSGYVRMSGNRASLSPASRRVMRSFVGLHIMRAQAARNRCQESYTRTGEVQMLRLAEYWQHAIGAYKSLLTSANRTMRRPELVTVDVAMQHDPQATMLQPTQEMYDTIGVHGHELDQLASGTGAERGKGNSREHPKGRVARADKGRAKERLRPPSIKGKDSSK